MVDLLWTVPLIVGAVLWAGCDVISDGVIAEVHPHNPKESSSSSSSSTPSSSSLKRNHDDEEGINLSPITSASTSPLLPSSTNSSTTTTTTTTTELLADYKKSDTLIMINESDKSRHHHHRQKMINNEEDIKLTGEQDSIISGIVMFICGIFLHSYYGSSHIFSFYFSNNNNNNNNNNGGGDAGIEMINPVIILYASLFSGVFQCFSLIYLLKAFESSSSTVIVPLMQLNSIFLLPMTIVLSLLSGFFPVLSTFHKIITPLHFIAFILIFIGGFYPAVEGEWTQFSKGFWKQRAVRNVLLSDLLIAFYYVLVTFCTNESGGQSSISFLIISIYGNSLTFLFLILFIPRFRRSTYDLLYIRRKYVLLSALGEVLSLAGYFFVSISYHLYYNGGIVSATEGALNQLFNLVVAIILKKTINFGRDVKRIKEKLYSCLIVTVGLILTST
ncbi:hypothetical protein DFA_09776 [Cavenderia fasciculata]|uniref:Transmembrane protein n=1 Tax=Cavenderia fasciculata TaxID=261658 RepID=F4Q8K4_CACFS|nr:uncharacterized protein DFA_09776 [Cavenderia fasciculata]EGG16104.1 hypothetical protein DFA_09776 [Cavenderia fasciculata]|eukprot:XP_004352429.1 hypothetical protein DFA_09776 [Cavenderia fasciculata]